MTEIKLRALGQQFALSHQGRKPTNTSSRVSGVGYAAPNPWLMVAEGSPGQIYAMPSMKLKGEDPKAEDFVRWMMDVVAFALPNSQAKDIPPFLLAMLELSLVIDKAAELLRNDSLDNIMGRSKVYSSILNLVENIGQHKSLLCLVQEDRFSKRRSSGLRDMSFSVDYNGATKAPQELLILGKGTKDQSLAKRLENLAIQSELILGVPSSEPGLRRMCTQINTVYKLIKQDESDLAAKLPEEQWNFFHKIEFADVQRCDLGRLSYATPDRVCRD